jgi:hypothetical protein
MVVLKFAGDNALAADTDVGASTIMLDNRA